MQRSSFKVGDRVAVYGWTGDDDGYLICEGRRGTLKDLSLQNDVYYVVFDKSPDKLHRIHIKQCRRLVKKPRRRLYALVPNYGVSGVCAYYDLQIAVRHQTNEEIQEFVEVRRKK